MRRPTRQRSGETLSVEPPGSGGLDRNTNPTLLGPDMLRTSRNMVGHDGVLSRRAGSAKVARFADPAAAYASKTFSDGGGDWPHATFTPNAQQKFPYGGWWLKFAFEANTPSAADRGALVSPDGGTGPVYMYLDDTNRLVAVVSWDGGGSTTLTTAALPNHAIETGLLIYDDVLGTLTVYLDGDSAATATPGTGKRPLQTNVTWMVGVDHALGTYLHSLHGAIGPLVAGAFRGADPNVATPDGKSLLDELREGTFQDWPNPNSKMVLWHYGMREPNTTLVMTDWSKFKNHGAYALTPVGHVGLVVPALGGAWVGVVRKAAIGSTDGATVNLAASAGALYQQTIQGGT